MLATPEITSPFLQILSLGFVWTFLHCSPMCGPIISGLRLGAGENNIGPTRGLLAYQVGRAIMYGLFGALAGSVGSEILQHPKLGWILVVVLVALMSAQIWPSILERWIQTPQVLIRATQKISQLHGWLRAFLFGALFAFLPCMLTFWALTVAASTKSAIRGALVMILLVGITTLPLLIFTFGMNRMFRGHQKMLTPILLFVSMLWTTLVTLAANDLISHRHLNFEAFNHSYTLMFW